MSKYDLAGRKYCEEWLLENAQSLMSHGRPRESAHDRRYAREGLREFYMEAIHHYQVAMVKADPKVPGRVSGRVLGWMIGLGFRVV